jgi:hypothetical protein
MTEKQKYYRLQSHVCESLPTSAINALVRTGFPLGPLALVQVRNGRSVNLKALIELVRLGLPDFKIPAELFPAEEVSSLGL